MKKCGLIILGALALLQGCGNSSETESGERNKIVLSAFSDTQRPGTFDERQLDEVPRTVNLKDDLTPVKNQSNRGTCTFFTAIALVEASIKKHQKIEVNLSEEYLNAATKTAGFFPKSEESFAVLNLYTATKSGLLLESDWPYRPSAFGKGFHCEAYAADKSAAPSSCLFQLPPENLLKERRIDGSSLEMEPVSDDTNMLIKFIARERRPFAVQVPVNFNGWASTGPARHTQNLHTECLSNPSSCGLHEILIYGYDLERKVFFFKNSWGKSWGREGHGEIEISAVDQYGGKNTAVAVKQKAPLNLPEDLGHQKAVLASFTPSAQEMANGSIQVSVNGQLKNTLGHVFYTSSGIGKVTNAETPQDNNTEFLTLNTEEQEKFGDSFVRALWSDNPEGKDENVSWDNKQVFIPSELVASETAQAVLNSERSKVIVRTTLFVHTDDEGFKILKRVYHPLKESGEE